MQSRRRRKQEEKALRTFGRIERRNDAVGYSDWIGEIRLAFQSVELSKYGFECQGEFRVHIDFRQLICSQ